MKKKIDDVLNEVLTPDYCPGDVLNYRIINQVKERRRMKLSKIGIAVLVGTLVAATSLTAVAAYHYLNPKDIAKELGDEKLAVSFDRWGADIKENGASVTEAGYKVTFLGYLTGEDLSQYQMKMNDTVLSDRSYFAVAIEREDGTPMDLESGEYFISPLVGSLNPFMNNVASWGGGYGEFVEDGVLYRLMEAGNVEYFADQNLYLCVTDTAFINSDQFTWDEAKGEITARSDYRGLNVLFALSIDKAKADPVKAKEFLDRMDELQNEDGNTIAPLDALGQDAESFMAKISEENLDELCVRLENTVETVKVDKEGYAQFSPWLANEKVSDSRGGDGSKIKVDWFFEQEGMVISSISGSGMDDIIVTTYTLNEDGTVTFAAYVPKGNSRYLN